MKSASKPSDHFTKFPEWLWGRFSPTTTLVYLALYSFAWMDDGARPSIKTVAAKVGVSQSTVNRSIRTLRDAGVLVVEPRFKDDAHAYPLPNRYTFPTAPTNGSGGGGTCAPGCASGEGGPVTGDREGPASEDGRVPAPVTAEVDIHQEDSAERESGLEWAATGGRPVVTKNQEKHPGSEKAKTPAAVSKTKDFVYDTSLTDSAVEQQAVDVVDLLNDLRVKAHKNPVTETGRASWLKSARIILDCHNHPFEEVCTLIRWACEDQYWSGRITNVFKLQQSYAELLDESKLCRPRRARTRRDDAPARTIPGHDKQDATLGFARLEDLSSGDERVVKDGPFADLQKRLMRQLDDHRNGE
jgi:hypothetical protein